ncbi:8608_t:CDS:2, partial [Cetraspora pellucida]
REETSDNRRKRMIRKINAARKYYDDLANSSQSTNEISNNQVRDYQFDGASQPELNIIPVQTQSIQKPELSYRHSVFPTLDTFLLADIQHELHMHNSFAQVFHSAGQFVREGQPVMLKISSSQGYDVRCYNCPTANEVAVLMIDDSTINSGYDILLQTN